MAPDDAPDPERVIPPAGPPVPDDAPGPVAASAAPPRVVALVLAAGGASRFAGAAHKLLTDLGGWPVVAWAVGAAAASGVGPLVVVSGAADVSAAIWRAAGEGVEIVDHSGWRRGQASSLVAGLDRCRALGADAAVVGLGDQPLVGPAAWRAVAQSTAAPVVTATYGGRRSPPVRLDREVWSLLSAQGDEGARALMRRRPELVAEVPCEGDPLDVDTLEDLRRAEAAVTVRRLQARDEGGPWS